MSLLLTTSYSGELMNSLGGGEKVGFFMVRGFYGIK